MTNVLSNHPFDPAYKEKQKQKANQRKNNNNNNNNNNNQSKSNETEDKPELSFAQMEGKCYCCGKKGHKSPNCRENNKPKSEWAINKATQAVQSQQQQTPPTSDTPAASAASTGSVETATQSTQVAGWMMVQTLVSSRMTAAINMAQTSRNMKNWILLDSESSVDLFCNPKYVTDIRNTDQTLLLSTNAGDLTTRKKATVPLLE